MWVLNNSTQILANSSHDSIPPRYIDINGVTYSLFDFSETKKIVSAMRENTYLDRELGNCDSLNAVLRERVGLFENINVLQETKLSEQQLLLSTIKDEREELKKTIENSNKRIKRQNNMRTFIIVLAVIVTAGLVLTVILKK